MRIQVIHLSVHSYIHLYSMYYVTYPYKFFFFFQWLIFFKECLIQKRKSLSEAIHQFWCEGETKFLVIHMLSISFSPLRLSISYLKCRVEFDFHVNKWNLAINCIKIQIKFHSFRGGKDFRRLGIKCTNHMFFFFAFRRIYTFHILLNSTALLFHCVLCKQYRKTSLTGALMLSHFCLLFYGREKKNGWRNNDNQVKDSFTYVCGYKFGVKCKRW